MKNILYLSCHAILEYDECKLLSEAGYNVRAIGSYTNPHSPADPKRPAIESMEVNYQHIDLANRFHQDNISQETLDWADIVISMHMPDWLTDQTDKFLRWGKPVIFRSIGQSSPRVEVQLNNLRSMLGSNFKIIKYSPSECLWQDNALADAIIPFYKDIPYTWTGYRDSSPYDVAFCVQAATQRGNHCHFSEVELATRKYTKRVLLGPTNEDQKEHIEVQCPDYEGLLDTFAKSKVLVYTGTVPASYTLSVIEAMFVGLPVITISDRWYRSGHEGWIPQSLFEVPQWMENPAFVADNPKELIEKIDDLINDPYELIAVSNIQTAIARKKFSKEFVERQWVSFLESV